MFLPWDQSLLEVEPWNCIETVTYSSRPEGLLVSVDIQKDPHGKDLEVLIEALWASITSFLPCVELQGS